MAYLSFVPLAVFALISLVVSMVSAYIAFAERRRAKFYLQTRRRVFRPSVIQGGKVDVGPAAPLIVAPDESGAETIPQQARLRLSILP